MTPLGIMQSSLTPVSIDISASCASSLLLTYIHRQHFHKLRKENGIALGGGRSAAAPQAKKATPSKGKKRVADEDNDDDEEPRNDSPSAKRVKKDSLKKEESYEDEGFASQSASSFKIEDLDDEGKPSRRQVIDLENDE